MSRGITQSTLLSLIFWAAVATVGLIVLMNISCRIGTIGIGC